MEHKLLHILSPVILAIKVEIFHTERQMHVSLACSTFQFASGYLSSESEGNTEIPFFSND